MTLPAMNKSKYSQPQVHYHPHRVWYHPKTDKIGLMIDNPVWGKVWIYESIDEELIHFFMGKQYVWIDDPRNPASMSSSEFIDIGEFL